MPIYEFRCLKCNELSEFLFTSNDDTVEMKCKFCGASELEKVMSTTTYQMGGAPSRPTASANTKQCGTGSCSTLEIPGIGD